ncbi:MAG: GNAT family N-acetyltransferase [Pseudomonadota bacterium]
MSERKIKSLPVTVTYLEQCERPVLPTISVPGDVKIALLRAQAMPVHFYRYLYDLVGRPYNWVSRTLISDRALKEIIHHNRVFIYVLYVGGVPAGFAEIDARHPKVPEIKFFGLAPDFVGQKLGPFFLTQIIDLAWTCGASDAGSSKKEISASTGPTRVRLETCTFDHPAALPLYQKFGFRPLRQRVCEVPVLPGFTPPPTSKGAYGKTATGAEPIAPSVPGLEKNAPTLRLVPSASKRS